MIFDNYKQAYHDAIGAIHQTEVIAIASAAAFKDFPNNLPSPTKTHFFDAMRTLADGLTASIDGPETAEESGKRRITRTLTQDASEAAFITPALFMIISRVLSGKKDINVDLTPL